MLTKFSLQKTESPATTDVRPSKIGAEFSGVSPLTPAGEGAATQVLRSSGSEGTGSGVSSTETEMCPTPESADSGVNAENNIDKNCAPVTANSLTMTNVQSDSKMDDCSSPGTECSSSVMPAVRSSIFSKEPVSISAEAGEISKGSQCSVETPVACPEKRKIIVVDLGSDVDFSPPATASASKKKTHSSDLRKQLISKGLKRPVSSDGRSNVALALNGDRQRSGLEIAGPSKRLHGEMAARKTAEQEKTDASSRGGGSTPTLFNGKPTTGREREREHTEKARCVRNFSYGIHF